MTPMYFCIRDEIGKEMMDLLQRYGAKPISTKKMDRMDKGELFGRVAATDQIVQETRQRKQEQEAAAAASKMNENMRLLQHRGEQLEEMGSKATQLHDDARNYADMAKQLKEKSKQKSKWLAF